MRGPSTVSVEGYKASAIPALHAAERRHGWFEFRLDGWSAWRVLRMPVYSIAAALPLSHGTASRANLIRRGLRATPRVLVVMLFGLPRDVLVKTFRSALRARQGEHFRDVYFDGVLDRQPSYFKVEVVNTTAFSHQAALALRPADVDAFVFTFWGAVLGRMFPGAMPPRSASTSPVRCSRRSASRLARTFCCGGFQGFIGSRGSIRCCWRAFTRVL